MSGAGRARFEITILLYPDQPTQSAIGLPNAVRSPQDGTVSKIPQGMGDGQSLYVVARRVLLDALVALHDQDNAITIVGAQAIYLRSVDLDLSVAAYTSDADLGLDPQHLVDEPRLQQAMTNAGFVRASADLAAPGHARNASGTTWSRSQSIFSYPRVCPRVGAGVCRSLRTTKCPPAECPALRPPWSTTT